MQDFVVIGGGIAGVSAGARLTTLGTVTVLEAENALGYHASGRSAALYEANYGLASTMALNRASGDYHRDGGYLTPRGLLLVAGAGDRAAFETDLDELHLTEMSLSNAIDRIPILDPDMVAFAAGHDAAWDIDTDRLIQDFARVVRGNGGQVLTKSAVTGIRRGDAGWVVETKSGSHKARNLVNAAGAWVDQVAEMAGVQPIGVTPFRRSMARIPAPGGHDVSSWPMLMGVGETWYAKPDAGQLIVSPAEADPTTPHDAYADDMVLAEGIARYEEYVTEPVTRMTSNWAGLRSFAPDRSLVIGPDPDTPDFIWCAGQGGYGIQSSPAYSQLLADLIAGKPTGFDAETLAALTPARLR